MLCSPKSKIVPFWTGQFQILSLKNESRSLPMQVQEYVATRLSHVFFFGNTLIDRPKTVLPAKHSTLQAKLQEAAAR